MQGLLKCVAACPKKLISFVPLKPQAVVRCSNCDKGRGDPQGVQDRMHRMHEM